MQKYLNDKSKINEQLGSYSESLVAFCKNVANFSKKLGVLTTSSKNSPLLTFNGIEEANLAPTKTRGEATSEFTKLFDYLNKLCLRSSRLRTNINQINQAKAQVFFEQAIAEPTD